MVPSILKLGLGRVYPFLYDIPCFKTNLLLLSNFAPLAMILFLAEETISFILSALSYTLSSRALTAVYCEKTLRLKWSLPMAIPVLSTSTEQLPYRP